MTIRVTAPNGATIEFPDGTDAETIQRVMLESFGGRGGRPASEPQVSSGEDIAKGFVGGLGRGVAGLTALPGTVETLGRMGVNWAGRRMGATSDTVSEEAFMPTYNDTKGALESVTGPLYEPKTTAGKYASTIGEFAPGLLFPGGVAQRVIGNVLAPALASEAAGQATEGTRYEGLARAAGSVAGTFAPGIARSVVTPYPITSPAVANARNTLHGAGISVENGNLTAGQATGNRGLRILEESTAGTTFGGRRFEELTEAQQDAFTRGAMGMVGVNSNRANAPALQQMRDQIDNAYTAVGQAATIPAGNAQVAADVGAALQNYTTSVPRSFQTRQVRDIANEINAALRPGGAGITGEQWLEWRRQLGSAARNSDDPAVQNALYNIQRSLDDAAYQSLPPNLQQTMDVARRDYQRGMAVERAARGNTPEAAEGIITPDALNRAVNVTNPDQYLRERGALADMAEYSKAGKRLLSKLPNSGTPERARAMLALGAAGSVVGGTGDILFGGEGQRGAAIGAAAGMLGHALGRGASARAVMNPTVQRYLANQRWVNDPINRRRSLVATSPQTLPGEGDAEPRADGGRITGKSPIDSKFRRNFIKQEMAAGRKYSDVVREMHGRKPKADGGFTIGGINTADFEPLDEPTEQYDRRLPELSGGLGGSGAARGIRRAMGGKEPIPNRDPSDATDTPVANQSVPQRRGPTAQDFRNVARLAQSPLGFLDPVGSAALKAIEHYYPGARQRFGYGYADGGEVAPEMTRYDRMRKAQQYRLRGMDPPAELMPTEADIAQGQQASENMGQVGQMAALSMIPGAAVTTPLRIAVAAAPRATAAGLGALGATIASSDAGDAAGASSEDPMMKIRQAVKGNVALEAKLAAWEQANREANEGKKGVKPDEAARLRNAARTRADEIQKDIFTELDRLNPPKRTFESEYPWLSRNLPLVQMGIGTGVGMGLKSLTNAVRNAPVKPWTNALRKGNEALEAVPPDIARAQRYSTVASEFASDVPKAASSNASMIDRALRAARAHSSDVAPALVGGYVGAEVAQLPHQYNLRNAPTDSPEYARASENRTSDTMIGGALGAMGAYGGTHFAPVRPQRFPVAETRALKKNVEAARKAPAPDAPTPEATEGLVPWLRRQVYGSPTQNPPPSQGNVPPSTPNPPPSNRAAKYGPAYSPESRRVLEAEMPSGGSNQFGIRNKLMGAFRKAGLPEVSGTGLEKRITRTMDALRQTGKDLSDPKQLGEALDSVLGRTGMLAIPAAVGVSAATADREERKDGGTVGRCRSMTGDRDVMDKAMRAARKNGGRVKKADGGMVDHWSLTQPRDRYGRWS